MRYLHLLPLCVFMSLGALTLFLCMCALTCMSLWVGALDIIISFIHFWVLIWLFVFFLKKKIWIFTIGAGSFHGKDALEVTNPQTTLDVHIISNQGSESQRLDDEIDKVLQALRKSQVSEYKIAEERLYAQKSHLLTLYKQLEEGRSQLSRGLSSASTSALLDAIVNTSDRIRREVKKLRDMEKVAKGFGKTPKGILKEHFTLEVEDWCHPLSNHVCWHSLVVCVKC